MQISAYGITLSFTAKDLEELGLLTEKNISRTIKFIQREAHEAGVKLGDLMKGGDIKSLARIFEDGENK